MHINAFKKDEVAFREFLDARGAELLGTTNEWEVLRFRTAAAIGVVYQNQRGVVSLTGASADAWKAFKGGHRWSAGARIVGKKLKNRQYVDELLRRDGPDCFYCAQPLVDDTSIEHLVPLVHGGPNRISNMALAHKHCNAQGGHMSVFEKIRLRDSMREEAAQ